jgi:hypothetical protein
LADRKGDIVRIFILTLLTLFVVLVLGVTMADSTFAFHPLFLTGSGETSSFTATSGLTVIRGLELGVLGTIDCETSLSSGEVSNKSTFAHKIELEYHGKCEQIVGSTKTACTEPIKFKLTFGALGLNSKKVVILLAPESGTELAKVTCGSNTNTVEGAVVGEFPETEAFSGKQYNTGLSPLELVFNSESKNENQAITSIELSGVSMTKAELKISGFFGGKVSLETTQTISSELGGLICTFSPAECKAPPDIRFRQFKGSNRDGTCPERNRQVEFTALRQWCEYEITNLGAEEPTYTRGIAYFAVGCIVTGRPECVEFVAPAMMECRVNQRLRAREKCFIKLEYREVPTRRPNVASISSTLTQGLDEVTFRPRLILN